MLKAIQVVGVMRLHDFDSYPELAIDCLAKHVDAIFFLAHRVRSPRIIQAAMRHPKTARFLMADGNWEQRASLAAAFSMLDKIRPQWVLYPDEDELLPEQTSQLVAKANAEGYDCISFPYLIASGDPDRVIKNTSVGRWPRHCKALKWRPDITFGPYCFPDNRPQWKELWSPWPLRHLCHVLESTKKARRQSRKGDKTPGTLPVYSWGRRHHVTVPYDKNKTWNQWRRAGRRPAKRDRFVEMRPIAKSFVSRVANTIELRDPIYEFGAYQASGTAGDLRPLFKGHRYVGCDYRSGLGVDEVRDMHATGLASGSIPTILCIETLEHVVRPWVAIDEMRRILQHDGILLLSTCMNFPIHAHPHDYWRFTPEGIASLLKCFASVAIETSGDPENPHAIVAVASKGKQGDRWNEALSGCLQEWKKHR